MAEHSKGTFWREYMQLPPDWLKYYYSHQPSRHENKAEVMYVAWKVQFLVGLSRCLAKNVAVVFETQTKENRINFFIVCDVLWFLLSPRFTLADYRNLFTCQKSYFTKQVRMRYFEGSKGTGGIFSIFLFAMKWNEMKFTCTV